MVESSFHRFVYHIVTRTLMFTLLSGRSHWEIAIFPEPMTPHTKTYSRRFKVYRVRIRGEIATLSAFLVPLARLRSSLYNVARRPMYHKTCFGGHYIPSVQFRLEG